MVVKESCPRNDGFGLFLVLFEFSQEAALLLSGVVGELGLGMGLGLEKWLWGGLEWQGVWVVIGLVVGEGGEWFRFDGLVWLIVKEVDIVLLFTAKIKRIKYVFLLYILVEIDYNIVVIKWLLFDFFHVAIKVLHCVAVELVLCVEVITCSLAQVRLEP